MDSEFSKINQEHLKQLIEFLKFEKANRKSTKSEVTDELNDLLDSRITQEDTYTGSQIIDALGDVPDFIENIMDRKLEHQRDTIVVLIRNAFLQAKEKGISIDLLVHKLEEEKGLKDAHDFCQSLIQDPESVMEAAPKTENASKPTTHVLVNSSKTISDSTDQIEEENARLKEEIQNNLSNFPQYVKLMQMIKEREIEIRGLKARL
ncbi:leucine zipper transcription factor-like protein 1 isoform X1 [Histomonas meleagridis]|uniref:leucine zipper transcription factor-like protein 1 isoform X1 n=1 Tax=Histomonas meleagridis TaxID=135588 RepID=UPI00355A0ACF|nr:leucine zipper transcription factor-like protein 1 isoform X1 [Histomonas meleagridis]KAH0800859.1 leucine zipper transcription factor-like protein 1 isoform X1 [Histomonas meleagridis]